MKSRAAQALLVSFLCLPLAAGCDPKESGDSDSESSGSSTDSEKQEQVDSLLRANGIDPQTLKAESGPPGSQGPQPAAPSQAKADSDANPVAAPNEEHGADAKELDAVAQGPAGVRYEIKITNSGAAPKTELKYPFGEGEKRNLTMDLKTTSALTVNGQPLQTAPPVQVTVTGTSTTLSLKDGIAQRENVFASLVPSVNGVPPEMASQVIAQYELLKGLRLVETVNSRGELLNVDVPVQQQIQNPQVLVLLQLLQDTLSRSRAVLPSEPVGKGATWIATASGENGGVRIQDQIEAKLVSLVGSKAIIELTIKQSSPGGKLELPQLPPGASVELLGISGAGTGQMELDTKNLHLTAKLNIKTSRDTKTIDPSQPAPVLETVETSTQFEVRLR